MTSVVSGIVRWVLSIALLYMTYTETGPWTTVVLGLLFLYVEITVALAAVMYKKMRSAFENPKGSIDA